MSEANSVSVVQAPNTRESIARDLKSLGLKPGMTAIVHSSISSIGWVCGKAVAVAEALLDAVGPEGTIVVPTHSCGLTEPSLWMNPPVPKEWWQLIRETMPAFDPQTTPTAFMGAVPELLRTWPGARRSYHPAVSFAAVGKNAAEIVKDHPLAYSMGEGSPLAKLYDLDAYILLLGVGHDSNTSLHLAEARWKRMPLKQEGGPVLLNGKREWVAYSDFDYDPDDFEELGRVYESSGAVTIGKVGAADARLMRMRPIVDFAQGWIEMKRGQ